MTQTSRPWSSTSTLQEIANGNSKADAQAADAQVAQLQ
jgi:hypothetical protein